MRRDILAEYRALGIKPIGGGEGEPAATGTETTTTTTPPESKPATSAFSAEQQAYIDDKIGVARIEGRNAEKKRREEADAEDKRKREQDEATKRGEFETVKTDLERERDEAKASVSTLQAELDKWREMATKELDASLKDLKAKAPKLAALDPGGDDLFARREWLTKALDAAGEITGKPAAGNGTNPPTNGGKPPTLEQTKAEFAQMMGIRARR